MSPVRECGVCWYPYDPAVGDDVWQIPPGTPFEALPDHWRCPKCDTAKERFLPLKDGAADEPSVPSLVRAYEQAVPKMQALPIFNSALEVEAVGFRAVTGGQLGIVVSPWFMNLIFLPEPGQPSPVRAGDTRVLQLPAGPCEFTGVLLEGVGLFEMCSLFSPMSEFPGPEAARATAEETLALLLTPPAPEKPVASGGRTRRELFTQFFPRP